MSTFNTHSRKRNVAYSSIISSGCNITNTIMGFIYRTFFLTVLSANYLGINGLFSNILQILSLADLGIATVITYRFYEPISREDVKKVGELMKFLRTVYLIIAGIILVLGLIILPFLDFFVKDSSEVPSDVNLQFVYILFLVQTLSSYLFSYRTTLLYADQKQYLMALFTTIATVIKYALMVVILYAFRSFTLTLIANICVTIVANILISIWVTRHYAEVFKVKEMLPRNERRAVVKDTGAMMCHKIGTTVLTSTDNLILTKYIGLVITGLYSNYALITQALSTIMNQLLGTFSSSFGSAYVELSPDENYKIYRKLQFVNFWISGMFTTGLFVLINDFIQLWLGPQMLLDTLVVVAISGQFFVESIRQITGSYSGACGLFVKDKVRPLIEAILNIIISIYLAVSIGVAGIFIGTIVSHLLTCSWREPLILFREAFHRSVLDYWKMFFSFLILTITISGFVWYAQNSLFSITESFVGWIIKALFCIAVYNIVAIILFRKTEEFQYFKDYVIMRIKTIDSNEKK